MDVLTATRNLGKSLQEDARFIEYAKNKGIEGMVTDHHEIPDVLPDTVVVNAKQTDQEYPLDVAIQRN